MSEFRERVRQLREQERAATQADKLRLGETQRNNAVRQRRLQSVARNVARVIDGSFEYDMRIVTYEKQETGTVFKKRTNTERLNIVGWTVEHTEDSVDSGGNGGFWTTSRGILLERTGTLYSYEGGSVNRQVHLALLNIDDPRGEHVKVVDGANHNDYYVDNLISSMARLAVRSNIDPDLF